MSEAVQQETSGNEVKIEDLGSTKKRLEITVPADVIDQKIEDSMGVLAGQTSLPGFRKGRAPKALLERRFGSSVRTETKNQVIADAYASAIEEHEIKPVGEPEPVASLEDIELRAGEALTFSVDVEVVPEFELPALGGLEIKKPTMEIGDDQTELEIKRQCAQAGEVHPVKGDFEPGDRLRGPGSATKEGEDEPFFTHDEVDVLVPDDDDGKRGQVLGLLIDDLGDLLKGKKIDDEITIETVGPESHEMEDIRGKKLAITVDLREAHRLEPAPIETVLAQYGMESEDVLKEQIKLALEQRRDEEQRSAMRDQVYAQLLESVDFDLPEKLSERQVARTLERQRLEMMYRGGLSADEIESRLAEMRAETEAQGRRRLKLWFLLHRLGDLYEIKVEEQEINGRVAAIAAQRGERPDKLRTELMQSGAIREIASQLREHKAADRVIDEAKVIEVSAEEWNRDAREKRETRKAEAGAAGKKSTTKKSTSKKTTSKKKKTSKS